MKYNIQLVLGPSNLSVNSILIIEKVVILFSAHNGFQCMKIICKTKLVCHAQGWQL